MSDPTLFPSIRAVAEGAENLPERKDQVGSEAFNNDDDDRAVTEIKSLCMNCREQGVTRMLLTTIPYFREVIVSSFRCEHCGYTNNEIQSAGEIRTQGSVYTLRVLNRLDLDRQIVKSATCTVVIPEFELTIPASRGQLTTVEGLVRDIVADLSTDQPLRRIQQPEVYEKIEHIINGMKDILADDADFDEDEDEDADKAGALKLPKKASAKDAPMKPFTVRLDDPAGNSFVEFMGSMADPKWNMRLYNRTREQNVELGLIAEDDEAPTLRAAIASPEELMKTAADAESKDEEDDEPGRENEEIYVFRGTCSSCGHPSDTLVKKVNIPYFKDILIMSASCDHCGYRDNEVKSGSAISEKGKKITLKVEDREDLSRDILKSETAGLSIPEIDLVLEEGTLGGRFTTLEGILNQVYEELSEKLFKEGDAKSEGAFEEFLKKLKAVKEAQHPFTLILDDPLANSYLQNLYAPDPDPNMEITTYERSWRQNEDLGLNDMKVEGYEQDAETPAVKPEEA